MSSAEQSPGRAVGPTQPALVLYDPVLNHPRAMLGLVGAPLVYLSGIAVQFEAIEAPCDRPL